MTSIMCATLAEPHVPGKDLVFCVLLALAWRKLQDRFGPLRFDPQPAVADRLNRLHLADVVDPAWVVVGAGFGAEGILEQLSREMRAKFPDNDARYLPSSLLPDALLAYGYLCRDLRFPTPFAVKDHVFQGQWVRAFGINKGPDPKGPARRAQVVAHDYVSPGEFVIELRADDADDRILIAQIPPCDQLGVTVGEALDRLERLPLEQRSLTEDDTLSIPQLTFEEERCFDELIGRPLCNDGLRGMPFDEVKQRVKLKLDEAGASVRAEAVMIGFGPPPPPKGRDFCVGGPFLLMLIRRSATMPYLALWVETPAWMEEQKPPSPPPPFPGFEPPVKFDPSMWGEWGPKPLKPRGGAS